MALSPRPIPLGCPFEPAVSNIVGPNRVRSHGYEEVQDTVAEASQLLDMSTADDHQVACHRDRIDVATFRLERGEPSEMEELDIGESESAPLTSRRRRGIFQESLKAGRCKVVCFLSLLLFVVANGLSMIPDFQKLLGSHGPSVCFEVGYQYLPLLHGYKPVLEDNVSACQLRCSKVAFCGRFTYFLQNSSCHLQSQYAKQARQQGSVSGPPHCDELPRISAENLTSQND
ncbi:unnamed protein product [Polarella glacialis]|uniref:Apple domain-containing protein n=2 Tax=Polarella glacialis TaxID=89957 RepID=A0A813JNL5_POLGL|nr:unnamed protein product [Polarella glacialis]